MLGPDRGTLDAARATLARELGPAAVSRAAAVAANFTKNDRTANAVGAPLEPEMLKATKAIREELGLNSFRSAASSLLHFPGA